MERRKNDLIILEKIEIMKEVNQDIKNQIQELEERRNENLHNLKMEIFEKVDESINKRIQHIKSSPETKERLMRLENSNEEQNKKLDLMACQVQQMYEVFTSTNFVLKTTIKIFASIGVITGSIIGVIELFKRTK